MVSVFGPVASGQGTDTTTHVWSLPSDVQVGDRVFLVAAFDGVPTATFPSSWQGNISMTTGPSSALRSYITVRDVSPSNIGETTVTVTTNVAECSACVAFAVRGGHLGAFPDVVSVTGTSSSPDPGNGQNSYSQGAVTCIWVAIEQHDNATITETGNPPNYGFGVEANYGGASGIQTRVIFRELAANSENPGAFTLSASTPWIARTLCVAPMQLYSLGLLERNTFDARASQLGQFRTAYEAAYGVSIGANVQDQERVFFGLASPTYGWTGYVSSLNRRNAMQEVRGGTLSGNLMDAMNRFWRNAS